MISPKTPADILAMREGGKKLWHILQRLLAESQVGVSLTTIESHAQQYIQEAGGTPSFMTVKGYQWATCLCLNDQVVHGIPSAYTLVDGDVFTIDVGMVYKGFHTDTAWTKIISSQSPAISHQNKKVLIPGMKSMSLDEKKRFLKVGEETLEKAIHVARAGNRVGHISQVIEQSITRAGYNVVQSLTGHGVGRALHEEPMIPEYLEKPIERTQLLTSGMTLAIEVIYAMGKGTIVYSTNDGWTLASKDRSLTAVFEQTIVVGDTDSSVLTGS